MATYKIDPAHSDITFKIKHLVISSVKGNFSKFDATMEGEADDFTDASISFEADVDSISTNNEQRDGHLKAAEFFDAENFPKLTFKSTSLKKRSDDEFDLNGDLTIRDVTKPVTLNVNYGGTMKDMYGQTKLGFEITGKINRTEFGLKWSGVTEAGGLVLGEDVRLDMNVEMLKQA